MRKFLIAALSAAALAFFAGSTNAADAPASGTAKIGVVEYQELISSSKAGKSLTEQVNKQRESFKNEFSKIEKDLNDLKKKLEDDKANQNTPEFATKRKEFESKMLNAQKLVQQKNRALEKGTAEAVLELRRAVVKVVSDIASRENYSLVLSRDNVIIAEKDMDITDEVRTQLDKDLPEVKLKLDTAKDNAAVSPAKK